MKMLFWRLAAIALTAVSAHGQGSTIQEIPGRLRARIEAAVPAEVSGVVLEKPVARNSRVEKGAVLVRLDPTFQRIALRRAEAQALKAKAEAEWAALEFQRSEALALTKAEIGSEVDRLRAQKAGAEAGLSLALTSVEEARELLLRTEIRSPLSGLLIAITPEVGEQVQAGSPIAHVVTADDLVAEAFYSSEEIRKLMPGDAIEIRVLAEPPLILKATCEEVALAALADRTFRVIAKPDSIPAGVRAGCEVRFLRALAR